MAKVISLRAVRKQKARDQNRATGTVKAMAHGRSAQEAQLQTRVAKALDQHLDRHKRDPD